MVTVSVICLVEWVIGSITSLSSPLRLEASVSEPVVGSSMVRIPGGAVRLPNRKPVVLHPFLIDSVEVTNDQYQRFVGATGHPEPGFWRDERFNDPQQPIVGVSWYDAVAYCEWAGKRLPREGEWLLAAGGPDPFQFPWGNSPPDDLLEFPVANYNALIMPINRYVYTSFVGRDGFHYTAPVGSFPRGVSPYGIYDMAGNVSEWVADYLPPATEVVDPTLYRVRKGGSWLSLQTHVDVTAREWSAPELRTNFSVGFRCAKDP